MVGRVLLRLSSPTIQHIYTYQIKKSVQSTGYDADFCNKSKGFRKETAPLKFYGCFAPPGSPTIPSINTYQIIKKSNKGIQYTTNPKDRIMKKSNCIFHALKKQLIISGLVAASITLFAQKQEPVHETDSDDKLLSEYVNSKGSDIISFDFSNIKQFWISPTVLSRDNLIQIKLNDKRESELLKIQLANVIETQDCRIDIITNDSDLQFLVTNDKSTTLSTSSPERDFIHYHIVSAAFHLEDTKDFSFCLRFFSDKMETLTIKKILLSFSNNKESRYLGSPGFNALFKQIEKEGISVPNSEVKYIISKEYNKIFIIVPKELAESHPFLYHVFPVDEKDFQPGRVQYKFNNYDFVASSPGARIPQNNTQNSKTIIFQRDLPSYQYSTLEIGQFGPDGRIWTIILK